MMRLSWFCEECFSMKMPSLPPLNRRATLLAAGGITVLVLLFCILAIALGGTNTDDTPRPATAETAENATPETPAATEVPRAADLAVQTAAVGTVLPPDGGCRAKLRG